MMITKVIASEPVLVKTATGLLNKGQYCLHVSKYFLIFFTVTALLFIFQEKVFSETTHSKNASFAKGWAQNSINATIFRRNAITSH